MHRRDFLRAATSAALLAPTLPAWARRRRSIVNDYSGLDAVTVADERRPRSTGEVSAAVGEWPGAVSVGGGRFSMGGQVAYPESLHIDMRQMNRVLALHHERRTVRVQAGISWRDLQDALDPHDLSVSIMQSFSNFTVGGSVSVNCHGRYVGRGPIVNSVRSLQLVTADGSVLELEPSSEEFPGVFGGYGGLGVVTEVELDLEPNTRLRRKVENVDLASYARRFHELARDPHVVLHNADLRPPDFDAPRMISWLSTNRPVTVPERLIPRDRNYGRNQIAIWAVSELPGGARLRNNVEERLLARDMVVWRNYEASLDTDSLEPTSRLLSTYLLQEYFIPVANYLAFARSMAGILKKRNVNALNVSIRHSPGDDRSLLPWAPAEAFSFVLYYKQRTTGRARRRAEAWTRELIDAALENSGRYYLPYRLHATPAQFARAYPEVDAFRRLKARVDPHGKFQNMLWDSYLDDTAG